MAELSSTRQPDAADPGHFSLGRAALSCADPHWIAYMAILFLPAVYNLLGYFIGPATSRQVRLDQFSFFAGLAIYAGVLKWIGWNVLTRHLPRETQAIQYSLFPAEIFCGLALCCAWFYFRNLLGMAWPSTYEISELAALKYGAAGIQIAHALTEGRPRGRVFTWEVFRKKAPELLLCFIFAGCLFAAFRDVSCALHVQSSDPLCHAYLALSYLRNGIFNGGVPAIYTSGFGAMNAVALALAPLTVVQVVALQHVLLNFLALFLITGAVSAALNRNLWGLHLAPAAYLLFIPLYNLRPWEHYEGTPRQAAPALAAAICLLPSLCAPGTVSFVLIPVVVVLLEWLCVALNPACAPFMAVLAPLALLVFCYKARGARQPVVPVVLIHAALIILCGAAILICDPFYNRLLRPAKDPAGTVLIQPVSMQQGFSMGDGVKRMSAASPAAFEVSVEETFRDDPRLAWLPAIAFSLLGLAGILYWMKLLDAAQSRLLSGAFAAGVAWFAIVYGIAFLRGGLAPNGATWLFMILQTYLGLVLLRMQVVIVFFILAACAGIFFVALIGRPMRTKLLACAGAIALGAFVLPTHAMNGVRRNAFTIQNSGCLGPVTHDDLKLVAWSDANLAGEGGIVGLGGFAFDFGPEKHLYPFSGAQAMVLYARKTRYCFLCCDPSQPLAFAEYRAHIENNFDAQWCLENNVRWFYIPDDIRPFSHALDRAIKDGLLVPIKTFGRSSIYKVMARTGPGTR